MRPKDRFLRQKQLSETFDRMVSSIEFEAGSDAAMLSFVHGLGTEPSSIEQSAANNYRREGAVRFLNILLSIAKSDEPPKREPVGELDYTHERKRG